MPVPVNAAADANSIRGSPTTAMDLYQILPDVFVGFCLRSPAGIEQLRADCSITAVLNVQTDEDMTYWEIEWPEMEAAYRKSGIKCRRTPVLDFNPDDLRRRLPDCVQVLNNLLHAEHAVYVHCGAG